MLASALLRGGPETLTSLEGELHAWLDEHDYDSVTQLQGSASQRLVADPSAFERANYMRTLSSYATPLQS